MSDFENGRPPVPGGYGNANDQQRQTQPTEAYPAHYALDDGSQGDFQNQYRPDQAQEPPVTIVPSEPAQAKRQKKRGGGLKAFFAGLFGVLAGAALVTALMLYTPLASRLGLPASSGSRSAAGADETPVQVDGQTITISGGDETTLANAVAAKALPSVVSVYVTSSEGSGIGSGVILDAEGHVLTNYHVAGDADEISVTLDGKSYDATLVGTDASSDLAVLKANFGDVAVTPIERGDSSSLEVGDWVMTLGSPFGLEQSVSSGIVSSLYRSTMIAGTSGNTIYANLIQVDANINPGNSGGALVNSKGQLVGISTLYTSSTESFAGIGYAIDGNYALRVADQIIAGQKVEHAYIGLSMATVNAQYARSNNLSVNQGAYVASVVEDGPAAEAGLAQGDVITAIDGDEISSADGVILAVRSHEPGDAIEVTYMRGSSEETVSVTLGSDEGNDVAGQGSGTEQTDQREQYYEYDYDDYFDWLEQLFGFPYGDDGYGSNGGRRR